MAFGWHQLHLEGEEVATRTEFAARMIGRKYDEKGAPMDDVVRYPEPEEQPDPRAQWDEVRGVWEVWDAGVDDWIEIGEGLDGSAGPVDGSALPSPVRDAHVDRVDEIAELGGVLGIGDEVGRVFVEADIIDRTHAEDERSLDELNQPVSDDARYPEPDQQPDPRAQWDEVRGVWEVWDAGIEDWLEVSVPLAPAAGREDQPQVSEEPEPAVVPDPVQSEPEPEPEPAAVPAPGPEPAAAAVSAVVVRNLPADDDGIVHASLTSDLLEPGVPQREKRYGPQ